MAKIGRNDPCTCGSGKKYKKCCGRNAQANALNEVAAALNDDASAGTKITQNTNNITTLQNRNINSGAGLSGGGDLTADRTLAVDLIGSNTA